ncbi:hypothetical protein G032_21260 [Pectobacterium carotovorum subsp. carotovorum ICMP 5702]|nr:hypothetical protein G032_21260 [Pectobacterium carotovorum subsp. carotovorum ICMP 5702]
MSESDQLRFHNRIVGRGVIISADGYINPLATQSLAEVNVIEPLLYERISQYAFLNGEDLQGMFKTKEFLYMSCFIRDVDDFKSVFGNEESLHSLFNHGKGDTAEILISFPEKLTDDNQPIRNDFIRIIQEHVERIDEELWDDYIFRAMTGDTVSNGFDVITGELSNINDCRDNIEKLSRKELVKTNVIDSCVPDFYISRLLNHSQTEKIGVIGEHSVYFNPGGYYFYWNPETEFSLESWLTFPAYPYNFH